MTAELDDLLAALDTHRALFRQTAAGMTDEQAALRPTASALCLGGVFKHVAYVEAGWADFMVRGADAIGGMDDASMHAHSESFQMLPGETLAGILQHCDDVAARTAEIARSLPNLDVAHPLPEAPWFEPGASWTARRVLVHILAEMTQHAGHADIIRETIDGARTMG